MDTDPPFFFWLLLSLLTVEKRIYDLEPLLDDIHVWNLSIGELHLVNYNSFFLNRSFIVVEFASSDEKFDVVSFEILLVI